MDIERREFVLDEIRVERSEDKPPKVIGHAAVFNELSEDLGGFREQILPGAFKEAIKNDDVRALFNHNPDLILARNKSNTLSLKEDKTGLAIDFEPPDTQAGRDLLVTLERGDVNQMSFGFSVRPDGQSWEEDDEGQTIRTLTNIRLFDVSPVVYPAYPQTDVAKRELRAFLDSKPEPDYSKYEKDLRMMT